MPPARCEQICQAEVSPITVGVAVRESGVGRGCTRGQPTGWLFGSRLGAFSGHDLEARDAFVAEPEPVREIDGAAGKVAREVGVHVMAFDVVDLAQGNRAQHLHPVLVGASDRRPPRADPGVTVSLLVLVEHGRVVREAGDDCVDVAAVRGSQIFGDDRCYGSGNLPVPPFVRCGRC